ncbi:MAG: hypothetical protein AAB212_02235 [Bacteroidota bacterium]
MSEKEFVIAALQYYSIEIFEVTDRLVKVAKGYEIEIEGNSLYKLISDGQVIAPFDNVDDLCCFILL